MNKVELCGEPAPVALQCVLPEGHSGPHSLGGEEPLCVGCEAEGGPGIRAFERAMCAEVADLRAENEHYKTQWTPKGPLEGVLETNEALRGENERLRRFYNHILEVAIDRWHETVGMIDNCQELTSWLDVSWEEYKQWLDNPQYIMEIPDA